MFERISDPMRMQPTTFPESKVLNQTCRLVIMKPGRASHVSCDVSIILLRMSATIPPKSSHGYGFGDGCLRVQWGRPFSLADVIEIPNGLGHVEKDSMFR